MESNLLVSRKEFLIFGMNLVFEDLSRASFTVSFPGKEWQNRFIFEGARKECSKEHWGDEFSLLFEKVGCEGSVAKDGFQQGFH